MIAYSLIDLMYYLIFKPIGNTSRLNCFFIFITANPSTPTAVMFPPKHPNLSTRVALTTVLAADKAAARPPGPDPTTKTSVS